VTVVHFALATVHPDITVSILAVPLHNLDAGVPDGFIEVYAFQGDGAVSTNESLAGVLETTETGLTLEYEALTIDVTALVKAHVAGGSTFLAFRFVSPVGSDRFDLGADGGVAAPTLTCSP